MSRLFFHLRDGEDILLDREGKELEGMDAIERVTLLEARSIISGDVVHGQVKLDYHIDVVDESGALVHRLDFEDAVKVIRGR